MGFAKRIATGLDNNRVALLIAVLEKKIGMTLQSCDVFLNVTGGLRLQEPSSDLAVVSAIASSFREEPIDSETILIGEIGLTGEVRGVSSITNRLIEAKKMGFNKAIIANANVKAAKEVEGIKIVGVSNINQVIEELFFN